MKIKIYDIDDVFDFGRNKGKTIRELLMDNPGYVDWCIRNIDAFALSQNAFNEAKLITHGKKCVVVDDNEEPKRKSLFKKLYGWPYDFSKEDIFIINDLKIGKHNQSTVEDYVNNTFEDDTDWSHYNEDLDMDQQSEDFWNQF